MRVDYPQLENLQARLTRERAEAIYHWLIAPVAKLFAHTS